MSGDIFSCHGMAGGGGTVTGIKWVEVRYAAKYPIMQPHTKNYLALNAISAKVQIS